MGVVLFTVWGLLYTQESLRMSQALLFKKIYLFSHVQWIGFRDSLFLQIFPQTDVIQTDGFLLLPLAKRLRSLPAASHGGMAELQIPIEVGTLPAMDVQMCPDLSSVYHPKIILFGPLRSYQVLSSFAFKKVSNCKCLLELLPLHRHGRS